MVVRRPTLKMGLPSRRIPENNNQPEMDNNNRHANEERSYDNTVRAQSPRKVSLNHKLPSRNAQVRLRQEQPSKPSPARVAANFSNVSYNDAQLENETLNNYSQPRKASNPPTVQSVERSYVEERANVNDVAYKDTVEELPKETVEDTSMSSIIDNSRLPDSAKNFLNNAIPENVKSKIDNFIGGDNSSDDDKSDNGKKKNKKKIPTKLIIIIVSIILIVLFGVPVIISGVTALTGGISGGANKAASSQQSNAPATAEDIVPIPRGLIGSDGFVAFDKVNAAGFNAIIKDTNDEYVEKDNKKKMKYRVKSVFPDKTAAKGSQVVITVVPGAKNANDLVKKGQPLKDVYNALVNDGFAKKYIKFLNADDVAINVDSPDKDDYVLSDITDDDIPTFTFDSKKNADEKLKVQQELNDKVKKASKAIRDGRDADTSSDIRCDSSLLGQKGVENDGSVWQCKKSDDKDYPVWTKLQQKNPNNNNG